MKIAYLSWSPAAVGPAWHPDGPLLPIEFAKTCPTQGLLIPVLCDKGWVRNVPTLWADSALDDLSLAHQTFAVREGVEDAEIGGLKQDKTPNADERYKPLANTSISGTALEQVKKWMEHYKEFDVVIWRTSSADSEFLAAPDVEVAKTKASEYLQTLAKAQNEAAATYIRQVPNQVWTNIREDIELHPDILSEPPPLSAMCSSTITSADDLRFKDWQECRTTIGRLDTILVDLRKFGFSLITGLLAAGASFLGFLGVQGKLEMVGPEPTLAATVFIAIMVLVAALYSVDIHFQILLSAAAERALDLEYLTSPRMRVTKYLSTSDTSCRAEYVLLALYLVLLATAEGLALFLIGVRGLNLRGLNLVDPWSRAWWVWCGVTVLVWLVAMICTTNKWLKVEWLKAAAEWLKAAAEWLKAAAEWLKAAAEWLKAAAEWLKAKAGSRLGAILRVLLWVLWIFAAVLLAMWMAAFLIRVQGVPLAFPWSEGFMGRVSWIPVIWGTITVVDLAAMITIRIVWSTRPEWLLLLLGAGLALLIIGGLAAFLLTRAVVALPDPLRWVVGVGTCLALYIEWYWAFIAYHSRLHRQKPSRIWPEGSWKVLEP